MDNKSKVRITKAEYERLLRMMPSLNQEESDLYIYAFNKRYKAQ